MENGRIISLDVGDKRVGIAVSDPTSTIVSPLETYTRKKDEEDIKYIYDLYLEIEATKIVVGLPLLLSGKEGTQAQKTRRFADKLSQLGVKIEFWDERLSTNEAEDFLKERIKNWRDRKIKMDSIAAAIILEDYLKEKN